MPRGPRGEKRPADEYGPDDAMFLPHEANPGRIEFSETTGIAFASQALAFSLITLLFKKRLLSKSEMDDLFEGVLETIENSPYANDPAGRIARGLIDGMAQVAATGGTLKPKADR